MERVHCKKHIISKKPKPDTGKQSLASLMAIRTAKKLLNVRRQFVRSLALILGLTLSTFAQQSIATVQQNNNQAEQSSTAPKQQQSGAGPATQVPETQPTQTPATQTPATQTPATQTPATQTQPSEPASENKAPNPADSPPVATLSALVEQIRQRITTAELEQPVREKYLEQLQLATKEIAAADDNRNALVQLRSRMESLTAEAEKLRTPATAELPADDIAATTTTQLESQLAMLQVRLTEEQQRLTGLQQRANEIPSSRQTLQSQIGKLATDAAALPPITGPPDVVSIPIDQSLAALMASARRDRIQSDQNLQQTRLSLLDAEVSLNLPQLRAESQDRLVKDLTRTTAALKNELDIRRKAESTARLEQAQKDQEQIQDPALRDLLQRTTAIATLNNSMVQEELPRWQAELKKRTDQLNRIRDDGDKLRSRIERFGTAGVVGVELLRFRDQLPATIAIESLLTKIADRQNGLEFERLDYREELTNAERALQELNDADNAESVNLWSSNQEILKSIIGNNVTLFSTLADLNTECRTLITVIQTWQDYVSVQAMWFPSDEMMTRSFLADSQRELLIVGRTFWSEWNRPDSAISQSTWLGMLPAVIALVLLTTLQRRVRRNIDVCSERATKRSCVTMQPTLRTVLLTIAMAALLPLIPIALGSLLSTQFDGTTESCALGIGLVVFGVLMLLLNFFRQTLRPGGLAESHFGWDESLCRFLRGWLHLMILSMAAPTVLYLYLRNSQLDVTVSTRLAFIAMMVVIAVLIARLLQPKRSVLTRLLMTRSPSLKQFQWILIIAFAFFPLALACLSIVGFHYTAASLTRRVVESIAVTLLLGIVYATLLRWLKVRRTRTAIERAKERAAQRERLLSDSSEVVESTDSTIPPTMPEEQDLELLGIQARALIRNVLLIVLASTLWGIWYEVLPALRVLSEHQLYHITEETTVLPKDGEPDAILQTRIQFRPITVGNFVFASLAAVMTLWAVRLLPSFIEVMLLSRMTVDTGVRYAILTISRYLMLIAGVVVSCQLIGLRWGNVQWLVAGLSVGLGFGLQEVFANFVSGIIILFERPVRIGDIVTIDGVTGVVSRIRIRATSITDWDRREYIVPNREFVTGKLLNWTLTDTTNRYVLSVGIGYGCDTVRAREIMLEIAKAHPGILSDPAPIASFEAFGDNSLNLLLRVYLPTMDNRLATISDLHTEIHRRFAEEAIEIPYPQRDVHIK